MGTSGRGDATTDVFSISRKNNSTSFTIVFCMKNQKMQIIPRAHFILTMKKQQILT